MVDISKELIEQVQVARSSRSTVSIRGHGSKSMLLGSPGGRSVIDVTPHSGIVSYLPDELVIKALAGTTLSDIAAALEESGQCLAAEPPMISGRGTLGGAVACGLSGPARPFRGSLRDSVLGVEMVNGLGERLRFGGEVFKNVAGFDVSRLMTGSEGAFGILLSASLRVAPKPERVQHRKIPLDAAPAVTRMREWAGQPLPLSGLAWESGELHWRFSGAASVVEEVAARLGGSEDDAAFWARLRDGELPSLVEPDRLWRRAVAPATIPDAYDIRIDWAGALRWQRRESAASDLPAGAFSCQVGSSPLRPDRVGDLVRRLKDAFDPDHLFNPGLIHADPAA